MEVGQAVDGEGVVVVGKVVILGMEMPMALQEVMVVLEEVEVKKEMTVGLQTGSMGPTLVLVNLSGVDARAVPEMKRLEGIQNVLGGPMSGGVEQAVDMR